MKNIKYISVIVIMTIMTACSTTQLSKGKAYKGFYEKRPVSVLVMPPINKTTNVEAKEIFHSTLLVPIANAGYYVIPPFMSMEILKRESAWDSEMFINGSLTKFNEIFGADLALFTTITKWNKTALAQVIVEVEYVIKSTMTNETIYKRKGTITYDASVNVGGGGIVGLVANVALSAISTAATKYVDVARVANSYSLQDLPAGKYSPKSGSDSLEVAGKPEFKVLLDSKYSR